MFQDLKACNFTPYQYYNLNKSLIVVCFLFLRKYLSIFRLIFKHSAWTASPLVEKKQTFWRTSNASRKSDFLGHFIGSSSKPSLTSITLSSPSLILSVSKNSAHVSEHVSGGYTAETSASTSVNKASLTSSGTNSGWRFRKASISFCKSLNRSSSLATAA